MNKTNSATREPVEKTVPKIMKFEMQMICTLDRTKTGAQVPVCSVQKVRVLDDKPDNPNETATNANVPPAEKEGDNQPGASCTETDKSCPLPSKETSSVDEEDAMMECLMRCDPKTDSKTVKADDKTPSPRWKLIKRKKDTV
jgi:hypothetical protein